MVEPDFELYHYKTKSDLSVEMHHHDFYEILIFLSGSVKYVIDGIVYQLEPNDILLINPQELHRPIVENDVIYERIVIYIKPEFVMSKSIANTNLNVCFEQSYPNKHSNLIRFRSQTFSDLKRVIVELKNLGTDPPKFGSALLKETYLTAFLIYLNRLYLESREDVRHEKLIQNSTIDKVVQYINQNLNGDLSLDTLSEKFFISKYHLSHIFKSTTGYTLRRFIQYKRLLAAKSLLKAGYSVTYVCHECGFSDYSNFIRAFRQEFGLPPKKYISSDIVEKNHFGDE